MRSSSPTVRAFTLVELLAVVVVIAVLAAIALGVAGYVQKRMMTQTARAQLAVLETALDNYKADFGYYPPTRPERCSTSYLAESTNNAILYRALLGQGKQYLTGFPPAQLKTNALTLLPNIVDVFGIPFNYYNVPGLAFGVSNNVFGVNSNCGYSVGGQNNITSFDLFSYGLDHYTWVPGAFALDVNRPWAPGAWGWTNSAADDITNWRR